MREHDAVYVISDLHLGGKTGFQIFDQGPLAGRLIDWVAASKAKSVALVINGDLVDFLAEDDAAYLDPVGAGDKLRRIAGDPAFEPVFAALGRFLAVAGRELVIVLGNHDVELALPNIRAQLEQLLCGDDDAARGRLTLALDGTGYPCAVGGRRVLCLHGNEVDTWNVIDHRQLLEMGRALNRGQPPPAWSPCAGTKLVVDIMNGLKKRFPFIDLLKPETKPVPAVLLALDPGLAGSLASFAPVAVTRARDAVRRSFGFLSAEDEPPPVESDGEQSLGYLLGDAFGADLRKSATDLDELLDRVEESANEDVHLLESLQPGVDDAGTLGLTAMIRDVLRGRSPEENLRQTLAGWRGDTAEAFDPLVPDVTARDIDKAVSPEVDVVITGHTHLYKALRRRQGKGVYFNSGTWIRLIELTDDHLTEEGFAPVFAAFRSDDLRKLDDTPGLVTRRPSVVSIVRSGDRVIAGLQTTTLDAGGAVELQPVPDTLHEV